MARAFPDGVWLVPLAPIEDPPLVTQAIFHALGLQDRSAGWAMSTLTDYLSQKHLLLVLDNCEHLLDTCAVLASTLLQACPDVRVLATSRQPLGIAGEVRMRVPSLLLPVDDSAVPAEGALTFEAVALLAERAVAVLPSFRVHASNATEVLRLCRRLDGIPLALELAAARLEALSLHQLNQALDRELSVLGEGNRGAAPRQQTLEATIDWSYRLLTEPERLLWARLSVFAGGFDEEAAIKVCSGPDLPAAQIVELLANLVEKSILKRDAAAQPTRYMWLETLRQYGRQKLGELGAEVGLQRRHRDWILGLAKAVDGRDERQTEMFKRIYQEQDNVWAALDFCGRHPEEAAPGIEICGHLCRYWLSRGPIRDARRVLASLLELVPADKLAHGHGLYVAAALALTANDYVDTALMAKAGIDVGRQLGSDEVVAWSMTYLGIAAWAEGRIGEADSLVTSALALARSIDNPRVTLDVLDTLCGIRLSAGDVDSAVSLGEEALSTSVAMGELWTRGYVLNFLSQAHWQRGEEQRAEALAREGAIYKHALDDRIGLASLMDTLASLSVERGAVDRAAILLGWAVQLRESVLMPIFEPHRAQHESAAATARGQLGDVDYSNAFERGRAMTTDEGVAYALEQDRQPKPTRSRAPDLPMPLTPREQDIARLVAQGLSNKQIAAKLVVSQRTAESHILNILNKLGFNSRTQIASWATANDLSVAKP